MREIKDWLVEQHDKKQLPRLAGGHGYRFRLERSAQQKKNVSLMATAAAALDALSATRYWYLSGTRTLAKASID